MARKRGNGEGGISRRQDGRWEARYYADTLDGRKRKTLYGKTRKEVAEKLAKAIAAQEEPQTFVPTNITVREFFAQYEDAVRDTMKRRSLETYQDIARLHLIPEFGTMRLKELTREQVQRLYTRKRDQGLSAARVRRIHGVLSSALNTAVRWRLLDHNVCREVSPPRVPPPEIRPFNRDEAKRFLAAAKDDRYQALYVLGLTTGMRLGEIGGLCWSSLDTDAHVVRVQRALITGRGGQTFESPKTPGSRRSIGLTKLAVEALERHRKCQELEGFSVEGKALVFTNMAGKPINPSHLICRSFKPIIKRTGLPNTNFHAATRHTFCCLALQQGINARTISLAMGHSSVAFTLQKYASYIPNYGDTAQGMDEALG